MHPNVKRRMEHNARMSKMMADREAEAKALHEYQSSPEAKARDQEGRAIVEEAFVNLVVALAEKR